MSKFKLTRFDFTSINPQITHVDSNRIELPKNSSYLHVDIEFELPENYLSQYENLDYVFIEKWGDDNNTIKVKYSENIYHNDITQSVYSLVERNHAQDEMDTDIKKVLITLNAWKI